MASERSANFTQWNANQSLLVRGWDDESVVYNVSSGDTHLLNAAATAVLRCLQDAPGDSADLAALVATVLSIEVDHSLVASVERILQDFSLLGIVKPTLH